MNYLLENNYLEKDEDNFALFLTHCAICVCTIPGGVFFLLILKCSIIDPNWKEEGSFLTSRQKQKKLSKMPYPLSRNNITEPKAKSGRTAKDWMIMEFL